MTLHNIYLSVDLDPPQAYTILTPCHTLETALLRRAARSVAIRRAQLGLRTVLGIDRSEEKRPICRAMAPRQIVFAIQGAVARQCAPSFRRDALLCTGTLRSRRSVSVLLDAATAAVCAASQNDAEERFQARQIACNNADVGLDDGPDGEVARVPEPVAGSAVRRYV